MNSKGNVPVSTRVVCYFCEKMFDNTSLLQGHIAQCSSNLENCPRRCGAWLQRRSLAAHALHCPRNPFQPSSEQAILSSLIPAHKEYATSSKANTVPFQRPNSTKQLTYPVNNAFQQNATAVGTTVHPQHQNAKHQRDNNGMINSLPNQTNEYNTIYTTVVSELKNNQNLKQQKAVEEILYASLQQSDTCSTDTMLPPYRENYVTTFDSQKFNSPTLAQFNPTHQNKLTASKSTTNLLNDSSNYRNNINSNNDILLQQFKQELQSFRSNLESEKYQRELLLNEISKIKRQLSLSEERNQILLATITTLRRNIDDESQQKNTSLSGFSQDMENCQQEVQIVKALATQLELRLEGVDKTMEREQVDRSHLELILNSQDSRLRGLHKLETDLGILQSEFKLQTQSVSEHLTLIQEELKYLKGSVLQDVSLNKEQIINAHASQEDILQRLKEHDNDISKFKVVMFDTKSMKGVSEENAAKLKQLVASVTEMRTDITGLHRERFVALTNHENGFLPPNICDSSGRLVWRISDFKEKLNDAIENESVLMSPIFYTSKYGYALQAEIFLNGAGKWRGRHITASVFRQPGEFDPLLPTAPDLTASISLKDQAPQRSQAMDIVKTLVVKRKEPSEDTVKLPSDSRVADRRSAAETPDAKLRRQYVFIPHTSLDKFDYIKNNVMFIEIIVTSS